MITLPAGLIGFGGSTRFVILDHFRPAPFKWLQSMDEPDLAFAIMDPVDLSCDYRITLTEDDALDLECRDGDEYAVFVILTVRSADVGDTTANLRGPVIVNLRTRKGKQVALAEDLPTRYPAFTPAPSVEPVSTGVAL
ncbi:flagellar assembly factor FliW [Nitrospira sp.]|nr:flagellar assembly factor FliW [Nitrospira sp.]